MSWLGGDGRKMDSQMPDGANLRETRLDRARLIMTIKCGRPGTGMPAFDKFAYSDGRCYGMKQADLKSPMPDPAGDASSRARSSSIADFLFAKVVGKGPMDRAKCIEYWGSDVEACREFQIGRDGWKSDAGSAARLLAYAALQFSANTNR